MREAAQLLLGVVMFARRAREETTYPRLRFGLKELFAMALRCANDHTSARL
jgi:hypothetical protein